MTGKQIPPGDAIELRRSAETVARQREAQPGGDPGMLTATEIQHLLHELRVHQVELEMQNEELRTTQVALDGARARYFDLYDLAPVGYLTISEPGLIEEGNLTAATLLGVPRGSLAKRPFARFLLPEDQDIYYLHRTKLFKTGERQTCDVRMVKGDGTLLWTHVDATVAGDGGKPVCRLAMSDITEHKFREDQRELTASLAMLLNSPGDVHHCISVLTASLQEWSGCEAVGIRLQDGDDYPYYETRGFPAEFVAEESRLCLRCVDGGARCDGADLPILAGMCGNVLRGRTDPAKPFFTDHGSFWTNSTTALLASTTSADRQGNARNRCRAEGYESVALIPLRDRAATFGLLQFNDHRPNRFTPALIAHFEELADNLASALSRRQAEEALRASEARHAKMVANIGDVIVIIDANGINRYKSPNIERCFGWKPSEVVGQPALANVHPDDVAMQEAFIASILAEANAAGTTEWRHRCRDGSYKWIEFTGVNLLHDPDIEGILGNYQDITERKQAEQTQTKLQAQLLQAQKMEVVGRLAGGVAHDFNNMVGVILGHAELALEQVDPSEPIHEDLAEIRKAAERSADLTRQLLAFARKQTVAPKVLDLNDTVNGTLKMLQRLIGESIQLSWQPGASLWPVNMDPSQLDQMLANLCINARDAIDGEGCLAIETSNCSFDETYCADHLGSEPGEYVRLAVSDTGCGMDQETQAHIFEPFFTTKEFGKGTGLGLSTVYGAVKQNRGFISVYSEPGKGSTFTIYLPRHASKAAQLSATGLDASLPRGHGTILLVEDEPAILRMATRMLQRQGYTVLPATTPGEAIRLAREHAGQLDLLMTDVVMPEMNGRDLAKNLLCLYPDLKRLFMSGYTADVIAHHGVLEEGVNFIQKPFSIKALADKVREVLGRTTPPVPHPA